MLAERRDVLTTLLGNVKRGREYGVRLFRLEDELRQALSTFSPTITAMEREAAATTSPGQTYLLARKLDAARKEELRRIAAEVASTAFDRLSACAVATAQDPLPAPTADQAGVAIMNASYLVAHDRVDDFRAAVTALVREYEGRGFRIEFTGPWPPYHFARRDAATAAAERGVHA
jgi:hypothetical protein